MRSTSGAKLSAMIDMAGSTKPDWAVTQSRFACLDLLQLIGKRGTGACVTQAKVPSIFSSRRKQLRAIRAANRQAAGNDAAHWLTDAMAEDIVERIGFMQLEPKTALIIGSGAATIASFLENTDCSVQCHDAGELDEESPFAGDIYDLIISLGSLDTVNDLPGALLHTRSALRAGGIFIAAILGAGSLPQMRSIMLEADAERPAARIHPFVDNRSATALLERAGFARQVVDAHELSVRYSSLERLVSDLRDQGLTNVLRDAPPPLSKPALMRAKRRFNAAKDDDGKVTETFAILTLTGWNGQN